MTPTASRTARLPRAALVLLTAFAVMATLATLATPSGAAAPIEARPTVDASDLGEITVGRDGGLWSIRSTSPLTLHRVDPSGAERVVTLTGVSGEPADLAPGLGDDAIWVALADRVVRVSGDGTATTIPAPTGVRLAALEPEAAGERMWFVATDAQPVDGAWVGTIDGAGAVETRPTTVPVYHDAELVAGPGDTMWALTGREVGTLLRIAADLRSTDVEVGTITGTPALGADGLLYVPALGEVATNAVVRRLRADGTIASSVTLPTEAGDAVLAPDGAVHLSASRGYHRVRPDGQVRPLLDSPRGGPVVYGSPGESVAFDGDLWYAGIGRGAGVLRMDPRAVPLVEAASEDDPGADGRVTVSVSVTGGSGPPTGTVTVVDLRCCHQGSAQAAAVGSATLDANGQARITVAVSQDSSNFHVDYSGDRSNVGTTSPDVEYLDAGGAVGRYVNQVYDDLLARVPEQAGFDYWSVQLLEGAPRTAVGHALAISTEHRQRLVERLFQTHLQRPADPAGRDSFVRDLARGATINQIRASILGSTEFFQRFGGGTVDGFIAAVYAEVLDRAPDEHGEAFWRAELARGVSAPTMASALLASPEALQRLVGQHFDQLLRRPVDAGGRAYWADLLGAGFREERLIAELIGSDEYHRSAVAGRY